MILVTGATGQVGRKLVSELAEPGMPVRALSRNPNGTRLRPSVDMVQGDLGRPETLPAALDGVDRVFLLSTGVDRVEHDKNLVAAAARAGVRQIVKLSALTVADDGAQDAITGRHRAGEQAVAGGGIGWTPIRPVAFFSNALTWVQMIKHRGGAFLPYTQVRTAAVDPADVAAVAARVLTSGGHDGKAYPVTGPELLSPADQIDQLAAALGRSLRVVEVPPQAARQRMIEHGMPGEVADAVLATQAGADAVLATQAGAGSGPGGEAVATVEQLTPRTPRTFAD